MSIFGYITIRKINPKDKYYTNLNNKNCVIILKHKYLDSHDKYKYMIVINNN